MNLYKVTVQCTWATPPYYVVASDPTSAADMVKKKRGELDRTNWVHIRNIECIAEDKQYTPFPMLLVPEEIK